MKKVNIDGKYPCMANWVVLKRRENGVLARNCLTDEEEVLTERQAGYLLKLNGDRHPLKIKGFSYEECREYYSELDDMWLIRNPGRTLDLDSIILYTVYIPAKKRTKSLIPKVLNFLLLVSFIPLLVYGLYRFSEYPAPIKEAHFLTGYVGGTLGGMILHEIGHAVACLSYHGRWLEAGFMQSLFCPGAYVLIDESTVRGRLKKVQISLAGVEMNLFLAGILLIVMSYTDSQSPLCDWTGAMLYAVFQNIFLALINLTFVRGLDGEQVISLLLGDGSAVDNAKANIRCILKKRERKLYFKENGVTGVANVCTSAVIMLFQLMIPMVLAANIGVFLGGIFS